MRMKKHVLIAQLERRKAMSEVGQYYEALLMLVLKCVLFDEKAEYYDWTVGISEICCSINKIRIKDSNFKLNKDDYRKQLIRMKTDEDYYNVIVDYCLSNKKDKEDLEFEPNIDNGKAFKSVYEGFVSKVSPIFAKDKNNDYTEEGFRFMFIGAHEDYKFATFFR